MNRALKSIMTLAGMVGCAFGGSADTLDVAFGTEKTVSDSATYETATVAGVLKVRDGAKLTLKETALGGNATTYAEIDVRGQGSTVGYYKDATKIGSLTIGAGGTLGRVVIAEGGVGEFHNVNIAEDAAADSASGYVDCLDIGGQLKTHCFQNPSKKPARLKFNGGWLQFGQDWSQRVFGCPSGQSVSPYTYVCECVNGNPVDIRQVTAAEAGGGFLTTSGEVSVEFAGTGDAYLRTGGKPLYNAHFIFNNDGWGYLTGGGTLIRNVYCYTKLCGDNCRGLVLTEGTTLEVTTTLSGVGINTPSLDATNGCITVADQAANYTWTMGNGNKDGFFRASLPNKMTFRKIGTGTTTVDAPSSAETLQIEAGTVRIAAPFACTNLVLKAGATLEVASRLSYGTLTNNGGTIRIVEGGSYPRVITDDVHDAAWKLAGGELVKTGAGTLTLHNPTIESGSCLKVNEGSLAFSGIGRTEKFWRLTVREIRGKTAAAANIADIVLYKLSNIDKTYDHNAGNQPPDDYKNLTAKAVTKESDLTPGTCAFMSAVTYASQDSWQRSPAEYFSLTINNHFPNLSAPQVDPTDPTSYLVVAWRNKDAAPPVVGYDLVRTYANSPKSWLLEASANGSDWVTADEQTDAVGVDTIGNYTGYAVATRGTSCAFKLPLNYTAPGATGIDGTIGVGVDADAALDFSQMTAPVSVNRIVIDASKGFGTLANVVLSETGTIEVVNVVGKITDYSFPMTLTDVSGTANLEKWSVVVDGVPMPRRTPAFKSSATGGTLSFRAPGLFITVK